MPKVEEGGLTEGKDKDRGEDAGGCEHLSVTSASQLERIIPHVDLRPIHSGGITGRF
ncbi:hypothetical protein EGR_09432 [Echinococcus granulosus]|uniref:Uncharacterized protein n=1 Tax=Echinococcus granulosus TaxID=6210 RepID=W6UQL9_ECHGR|nr:hypothetical protein EGR_09432 [Echinococcus granulosus]EUB55719.1 hypothetical protein EGR_09432 [Echinococcus granulosus]